MTVPAALGFAAALLALYLGASHVPAFFVPRWRQHRWFVLMACSACAYVAPNALLTLRVGDGVLRAVSRLTIGAAAVHVLAWARYARDDLGLPVGWKDRLLSASLLLLGMLFAVPHVGLTGRVIARPSPWLGVVYRVAQPTPIGGAIFVLLLAALASVAWSYARAAARAVPYATTHLLSLLFLIAAGLHDSLVSLGLVPAPYLLDAAFCLSVTAVGLAMSRRWADDVRLLDEALHAREDFIFMASHELRTPLAALQMEIQFLQRVAGRAEPIDAPRLDRVSRVTRRLVRLVGELLDTSRIEGRQFRLDLEPVELTRLVREAADRVTEARRAGASIHVTAGGEIHGRWDGPRLEQVVENLLDNAVKYGGGRPVDATVRTAGDQALVEVHDRGIGIPPGEQERIFGRFERAPGARRFGGLGLGLYIARQIVDAHGGTIAVRSEPGDGTTFTVGLPLEPQAIEAPGEPRK